MSEWQRGFAPPRIRLLSRRVIVLVLVAATFLAGAVPLSAATLKLATLVPEGSVWDKALREMADNWRRDSDGRVVLRIYPGGVAGSELDVLRKMRIGQLQAATLTTVGLEQLDAGFKVLTIPLFFDSYEEFFYVLDGLAPQLEQRLAEQGFVLLHWGHAGWVHFFSRTPVQSIADLKRLKIFVTAGSEEMVSWWTSNGFKPVALSPTDIMTGLQTGMIDVLPTTPLAGLSLQWFRQTPYMHELGLAPLTGATIVSRRAWDRISEEDRARLRARARAVEQRLVEEIPRQDQQAVEEMKARGLEVMTSTDLPDWEAAARSFGASMRGDRVPAEIFDRALELRTEFRNRQQTGGEN